jgi:hypothetical protein
VVVSSVQLAGALAGAGLPHSQFFYGGPDWRKAFLLDEHDRLAELRDE